MIQSSHPSILNRFRSLLAEREEEYGISDYNDVPQLSTAEVVQLYEIVLSELKSNSKLVIGDLTMIAGEHKAHAEGIADAICARVFEVPAEQKLSSLYLLDSIVKNIGCEYVRYFASRLPEMFRETYRQVHPKFCPSMRHLFGTWSALFPPSVLHKIETELEFSAPISRQSPDVNDFRFSESPRPAHGIHVNPKYLEARRQFEHPMIENVPETDPGIPNGHKTTFGRKRKERDASASPKRWSGASLTFHNAQSERGILSRSQLYGRKPTSAYDQYNADRSELNTSRGSQKLGPAGDSASVSSISRAEKLVSSKSKLKMMPTSPSRIGPVRSLSPSHNELTRRNSPKSVPQLHSKYAYDHFKLNGNDGKRDSFLNEYHPDDSHQLLQGTRSYKLGSGYNPQDSRALIDAYGNDRSNKMVNDKPLKVDINVNDVVDKVAFGRWQDSKEDEYMWEDMSPTLANQRGNDLIPPNLPLGSLSTRASLEASSASHWKPEFRRGSWDPHAPLSVFDDSVTTTEERISILGPGARYASSQGSQYATTQSQGCQQPWKLRQHLPQSPNHHNAETNAHVSLSMTRMTASPGQYISSLIDKTLDTEAHFQRHSNVISSMESSNSKLTPLPPASAVNYSWGRPQSPSKVPLQFPPANASQSYPRSLLPNYSQKNQIKEHPALMDAHKPLTGQARFPNQQAGFNSLNRQSERQTALSLPQVHQPHNAHETYIPSFPNGVSSSMITQPPWNHGAATKSAMSYQTSSMRSSSANDPRRPDSSFHVREGTSHPMPLQIGAPSQNIGPVSNPFSSLINSLVAHGLIPGASPAAVQDSVGVEFNPDLLKVRYESAINALYGDLPRKCTTCGLRFKCQEKHSSHMDWHVTKNRVSKNCKQKASRKWFVSTSVWLSGAEAVGSDAKPGFWSVEANVEEKVEKEIAVPADENQDACALCGEPFDNFYSDELEEWMYRGAVYLNAPNGLTNMDRSLLGPIVHAKCRSESEVNTLEDFGLEKEENKIRR